MENDGIDALDAFMMSIKSGGLDTKTRTQMKHKLVELRQKCGRLERLVHIAKPSAALMELKLVLLPVEM